MIGSVSEFLIYAVALESEAVQGYELLSTRMQAAGRADLSELFGKLGGYSRLHRDEAIALYRQHAGSDPDPAAPLRWPDGTSPENPCAAEPGGDVRSVLLGALALERRACDFYSLVANQSRDAQVQELAQGFADEESEHVAYLERWLLTLDAN